MANEKKPAHSDILNEEYQYGFRDKDVSIYNTVKG